MLLPLLYPILDADSLAAGCGTRSPMQALCEQAMVLAEAGCTLMQYRAKRLGLREALAQARELRRLLPTVTLIMNDRADLCLAAAFDGVHVGQDDISPEGARAVVGSKGIVGISTHSTAQFAEALSKPVDYVAIGPVYLTSSKDKVDPVVGLEGVTLAHRMRERSGRALPLVAIGGITLDNATTVLEAGADSLAVIGALSETPRESAKAFFRLML